MDLAGWIRLCIAVGVVITEDECAVDKCPEPGVAALHEPLFGPPDRVCKAHADALAAAGVRDDRADRS